MLVIEGQRSAEQRVQDDPARPDVHLGPRVQLAGNDLGGGVVGGAAARTQKLAIRHHVGEAC